MNYEGDKLESCTRYAPFHNDTSLQCVPEEFSNITIPCESFVFEEPKSFVKEVCITLYTLYHNKVRKKVKYKLKKIREKDRMKG
jgi:hypothetical protein